MSARWRVRVLLLAVLAAGACTKLGSPADAGRDDTSLPDVSFDPGLPDPGPGEVAPDPGPPDLPVADDAPDPGADDLSDDDPGVPTDPGTDPGTALTGKVEVSPYTMEFGYVQAGASTKRPLQVKNLGPGALRVDRFRLTGSPDFLPELDVAPQVVGEVREWTLSPPRVLAAGEAWQVPIAFAPTIDGEALAEVEVQTSDTDRPTGPPKAFLRGNQARACARFVPATVDFDAVVVGESMAVIVKIQSCGVLPLEIRDLSVDAAGLGAGVSLDFAGFPGGVAPTDAVPVTLPANGSAQVRVVFAPTSVPASGSAPLAANVILLGNQFTGATFLPLAGTALSGRCAQPRIRAFDPDTVPACSLLSATGADSSSFFGPVTQFAWVLDQPAGNLASLVPDGARQDVAVFAGLPGIYTFHLQVGDDQGHGTCGEDVRSVTVTQRLSAAVVLAWRDSSGTPGAPGSGPDLDLHFLHPSAPAGDAGWYSPLWDCYYVNPDPDQQGVWQMDGGVSLVSDSPDGMLPEAVVVNLAECVGGRKFRFGVHYPAGGPGDATATLTAYVNGTAPYQREVVLHPGDLWDAGTLTCGSGPTPTTVAEVAGPRIVPGFVPVSGAAYAPLEARR